MDSIFSSLLIRVLLIRHIFLLLIVGVFYYATKSGSIIFFLISRVFKLPMLFRTLIQQGFIKEFVFIIFHIFCHSFRNSLRLQNRFYTLIHPYIFNALIQSLETIYLIFLFLHSLHFDEVPIFVSSGLKQFLYASQNNNLLLHQVDVAHLQKTLCLYGRFNALIIILIYIDSIRVFKYL